MKLEAALLALIMVSRAAHLFRCDVTREIDQYYFNFVVTHEKQLSITDVFLPLRKLNVGLVFKPHQSLKLCVSSIFTARCQLIPVMVTRTC